MNWFSSWFLTILCFHVELSLNTIRSLPLDEPEGVVTTIADVQRIGEAKLDDSVRRYIGSGAGEEQTLRENIRALKRLRFRPHSLVDVSQPNTSTSVLGHTIAFPIGLSPSAAHRIADDAGEKATAKAAEGAGTLMILSAMSSTTMEDVRFSAPDLVLWQQLYIFRNRSLTSSLVRRAEIQGMTAIVVTVDSPISGQASFLAKNGFVLPKGVSLANLDAWNPDHTFSLDPTSDGFVGVHHLPSSTWDDILWLRSITSLPIVAKGILTPQDAIKAVNHGVAAVIVSNHGGRVLDGTPATIEALPEIVAAVGNRTEIYMDGGIRSGADAVKALSLGARVVFIGRPVLWGLAYNGQKGVETVLSVLHDELVRTMQLLGCPNSNDLNHDYVVREEYYRQF